MADSLSSSAPNGLQTFGLSWPLLVAVLVVLGSLGSHGFNAVLADPDIYWHIATGQRILEQGAVPHIDPYSHSMPGAAWMPHHWLSEVGIALVYQWAGWSGLVVLAALVFAGTLAYMTRFLVDRMEPVHALLFTGLAAGLLLSHLLVRPHVLVWPLIAIWAGELVRAAEQRRLPAWWLLALMILWANLHGSFTLGFVILAPVALEAVLSLPSSERRGAVLRWSAFAGLSVAAAMLTPSGWQGLQHSFEVARQPQVLSSIIEWRSPDFQQFQPIELWLLLMLGIAYAGRVRLPWWRLLLVLGLTHMALKHQRHASILGLIAPLLMAAPLARQWRVTASAGRDAESLDRLFHALAVPARPKALAAGAVLMACLIGVVVYSGRHAPAAASTPEAALRAAMAAGATGPVLNSYGFGGYLIYRGIPVFIDGRAEQLYGDALVRQYLAALQLADTESLPRLLDKYRIGWTLLQPGTPALAMLDHLPGWRRIYADAVGVVHVRDDRPDIRAGNVERFRLP